VLDDFEEETLKKYSYICKAAEKLSKNISLFDYVLICSAFFRVLNEIEDKRRGVKPEAKPTEYIA